MKKILFIVVFLVFISHFFFRVYSYKENYVSRFDPKYWKDRYLNSQWVDPSGCDWDPHINPVTCVWDDAWFAAHPVENYVPGKNEPIGDDGLYAYAGWEYVHGKDPSLLNAEIPPLGKYLIGLSILVFNNQNIFAFISGILFLISFYFLNTKIFKEKVLAFLPVALFSFEPLFYTQLRAPFLDLLYGTFLFLVFYFFLTKKYILSSIFLGCMMATKASVATFAITEGSIFLYLFTTRKINEIKNIVFLSPVAFFVLTLSYLRYFLLGHNIFGFLKVQKWIISFYGMGAKGKFADIFQMIMTGKWSTWFSATIPVTEWQITWPLVFIFSFLCIILIFKYKYIDASFLFVSWIFVYGAFLLLIPVFPRYLLILLPFFYTLLVYVVKRFRSEVFKSS